MTGNVVGRERRQAAAQAWVEPLGSEFGRREDRERSLVQPRVGKREVGRLDDHGGAEQQVEVERPWSPPGFAAAIPSGCGLQRTADREQAKGVAVDACEQHGVEVVRLRRSDRRRTPQRGSSDGTEASLEGCGRADERGAHVPEVSP